MTDYPLDDDEIEQLGDRLRDLIDRAIIRHPKGGAIRDARWHPRERN